MSPQLNEILKLSIPERILFVEAIWDSIANETLHKKPYELTNEQVKFLEEELAAYSQNPDEGDSWEDIKKRMGIFHCNL